MATANKQFLLTVHNNLESSLTKQVDALPKDFNKQRFLQNCMTVLQDGKSDFSSCEPNSVVRTLLKGAFLGLDFFNGECYAIPYKGKCEFQTDYKGEIKLCKKYSQNPIKDIYAKLVREGDVFEEHIVDGNQSINFDPVPFNDGNIIGAFAVALYQDGSMIYDSMSKQEIDHTRTAWSKAADSKAWKESYGEMAKKTVLRRLCKLIDLDFDNSEQAQAFEEGSGFDVKNQKEPYKAKDIYNDSTEEEPESEEDIIDSTFTEEGGTEDYEQSSIFNS